MKKHKNRSKQTKKINRCEIYEDSKVIYQQMMKKNRYFIDRMHNQIMGEQMKLIKQVKQIHYQFTQRRNQYEVQKMLDLIKKSTK